MAGPSSAQTTRQRHKTSTSIGLWAISSSLATRHVHFPSIQLGTEHLRMVQTKAMPPTETTVSYMIPTFLFGGPRVFENMPNASKWSSFADQLNVGSSFKILLHCRRVTCDSKLGSLTTQGHLRLVGVTDDSKIGSLVPTGFFKGNTFRAEVGVYSPA